MAPREALAGSQQILRGSHLAAWLGAMSRCPETETQLQGRLSQATPTPCVTTAKDSITYQCLPRVAYILGVLQPDAQSSQSTETCVEENLGVSSRAEPLGIQLSFLAGLSHGETGMEVGR